MSRVAMALEVTPGEEVDQHLLDSLRDHVLEYTMDGRKIVGEARAEAPRERKYERVEFRLIAMPCCGFQLCWVNPRLPNHCPECGESTAVGTRLREAVLVIDRDAQLHLGQDPEMP
jgi:hypothetical protein